MTRLSVMNAPTKVEKPKIQFSDAASPYTYAPDLNTEEGRIEKRVVDAIKTVVDPEIPVNIFELGLIYGVAVDESHRVKITMTLTAPNCPVAQSMPEEVRSKAAAVEGASGADIDIVWDPPWNPSMMSEAARLELNL